MKFLFSACCLFIFSTPSFAESELTEQTENILSPDNEPYFNFVFGFSPFDGILGLEYQKKNHSFGIGLPGHLSYRNYANPYQDTKFWGIYLGSFSLSDTDKTIDNEKFTEVERSYFGVGIGYRWQWPSGWNVSASIAFEYNNAEYSNPDTLKTKTEKNVFPLPGINVGYKF